MDHYVSGSEASARTFNTAGDIPKIIGYLARNSYDIVHNYHASNHVIKGILVRLFMEDLFHKNSLKSVFSIYIDHDYSTMSSYSFGESAFNPIMWYPYTNGHNFYGSYTVVDQVKWMARFGMIWSSSVPKRLPQIVTGLDNHGNLSRYINQHHSIGLLGTIMPINPATSNDHIKVINLIHRKYARKMRFNLLMERPIFNVPIEALRLWYDISVKRNSAEEYINEKIQQHILRAVEKEGLLITEKKENILDQLIDRDVSVRSHEEILKKASEIFKKGEYSQLKCVI